MRSPQPSRWRRRPREALLTAVTGWADWNEGSWTGPFRSRPSSDSFSPCIFISPCALRSLDDIPLSRRREGQEEAIGDAGPAPTVDDGIAGRTAQPLALALGQREQGLELRAEVGGVRRGEARQRAVLGW